MSNCNVSPALAIGQKPWDVWNCAEQGVKGIWDWFNDGGTARKSRINFISNLVAPPGSISKWNTLIFNSIMGLN